MHTAAQFQDVSGLDPAAFYGELVRRNRHFISPSTQEALSKVKVFIAGCGATGGACIESLARVGVQHFALADNGLYELNNLNRQHASIHDLGRNKAEVHASQVRAINPHVQLLVHPEGVCRENIEALVDWADFIVDAIDVTQTAAMAIRFELHRHAHARGRPVVTGLDLGYCQWGRSFDYRDPSTPCLGGHDEDAVRAVHPIKALLAYVPLSAVPPHVLPLVYDVLTQEDCPASQLGCASDLLSSIIVAVVVRFVESGTLVPGWNINLESLAIPRAERLKHAVVAPLLRRRIRRRLAELP